MVFLFVLMPMLVWSCEHFPPWQQLHLFNKMCEMYCNEWYENELWAWLSSATVAEVVCCVGYSGLSDCGSGGVCERDWPADLLATPAGVSESLLVEFLEFEKVGAHFCKSAKICTVDLILQLMSCLKNSQK